MIQATPSIAAESCGGLVRTLSGLLDRDETSKLNHAHRVAVMAHDLAGALYPAERDVLFLVGLLHDIGAIGIGDHIVHLVLAGSDAPEVARHPGRGARIFSILPHFAPYAMFIEQHHERFDGRGYPKGLKGDQIVLEAGILGLVDQMEFLLRRSAPSQRREDLLGFLRCASETVCSPQVAETAYDLARESPEWALELYEPGTLEGRLEQIPLVIPDCSGQGAEETADRLMWIFAYVIDAKHAYTTGHSLRTAYYAYRVVRELGLGADSERLALRSGLLHDIGKVSVPRSILDKKGALSPEERTAVQRHASETEVILAGVPGFEPFAKIAAAHHERFDGAGYPRGLRGEEIPLLSRILCYADVYDALTSTRAYREPRTHAQAIERIALDVGTQFDPGLYPAVVRVLQRDGRPPDSLYRAIHRMVRLQLGDVPSILEIFEDGTPEVADG